MTINIEISKASNPDKKYKAAIQQPSGRTKTIQFGQAGASDYTKHKDPQRKQRYLNRHRKNEDWTDHTTASFYATNILWNKPTITESIKDTNNRFKNLNIKLKT